MADHAALKRRSQRPRPRDMGRVFASIADYTYDWESWIDSAGTVRWVNPAVERMTGYTVAECLAMPDYPRPLVHPEDRKVVTRALRAAVRRTSGNDVEFRILHRSGELRWGAISWQSVYDDRRRWLGYRTSVRDISNRKEYELGLQKAKQEAEQANQARSEFLAMMSHELRSPIQCIAGYARLLGRARLSARQRSHLEVVSQQSDALLKSVDDLLELSALQSATAPPLDEARFVVGDLVRQAVLGVRPQARKKRLRLKSRVHVAAALAVLGDEHRLKQILGNLLSNAIKFTAAGEVSLEVDRVQREDDEVWLSFTVRDTGIGIAPETLPRLFQPFVQGDASIRRRFGGSGLGLALSQRLAALMAGRIDVASAPGRGSRFTLTVPFARAHPARTGARSRTRTPTRQGMRRLSVLVVDDNEVAAALMLELLRSIGCRAECVDSGSAALRLHQRKRFDVVFMDVQMPGIDGLAVTRALRRSAHAGRPSPLIVAVTANVLAEDRRACLSAGMDRFLGKPVSLAGLRAVLGAALSQRREEDATPVVPPVRVPATLDDKVVCALLDTKMASGQSAFAHFGGKVARLLPERMRALQNTAGSDAGHVSSLLHDIAGLAAMIGARGFAKRARQAEARVREGASLSARELDRLARAAEDLVRWFYTVTGSGEPHA